MPEHIKALIELLFHKISAMKFPPISMSGFQSIYHFTVNAHCTHFLPGAPLTANFSVERECPPSSVASKKLIFRTIPLIPIMSIGIVGIIFLSFYGTMERLNFA